MAHAKSAVSTLSLTYHRFDLNLASAWRAVRNTPDQPETRRPTRWRLDLAPGAMSVIVIGVISSDWDKCCFDDRSAIKRDPMRAANRRTARIRSRSMADKGTEITAARVVAS